jgi:arginase
MAPYGVSGGQAYQQILNLNGANPGSSDLTPDNLIHANAAIMPTVEFDLLPDDQQNIGRYLKSALSMQENTAQSIEAIWSDCEQLIVLGGDHSVSIGTAAGLARVTDLARIGLIWIDAHGDINTDQTSASKSITGYPLAVATGLGPEELTSALGSNFIKKVVHIGLRDCEEEEAKYLKSIDALTFSPYDIDIKGLGAVLKEAAKHLKDCDHIWISCDVDVLDSVYFEKGETDLPVPAGLTPREVLTITRFFQKTGKLKIMELVQVNESYYQTPVITWASRIVEAALGVGSYRYGQ